MLAIERLNAIKDLIRQQKSVLVSDLAPRFQVTEETIRRDLKRLEDEGIATRVYGGAYCTEGVQNDMNVTLRETILVDDKRLIAERCLPFIANGDSIYLDASTTVLQLAMLLSRYTLTVITNSLKVVECLAPYREIRLTMVGGVLHHTSMSFLGQSADATLAGYYVDKAFVSCRSLSLENGITDSNEDQSAIRRLAIKRSDRTFLLADHTKFGHTSFSKVADYDDIDAVITDRPLSRQWIDALRARGAAVVDGENPSSPAE